MACPSCGGELNYDDRFAALTVCPYCQAAVVFDERSLMAVGKMAMLARPSGQLFLGASGTFRSRAFSVIGRVRYAYEEGAWDEWYISFSDGKSAWLSEDNGDFVYEKSQKLNVDPEVLKTIELGKCINFTDGSYVVNETGTAVCEGGEGQLPFRVLSGEEIPFLELRSEKGKTATIEIEPDGTVKAFIGERLERRDLTLEKRNPFYEEKEFTQADIKGGRERISYDSRYSGEIRCLSCGTANDSTNIDGDIMSCSSCQTPINLHVNKIECPGCGSDCFSQNPEAKALTCEYCGSMADLSKGKPSLLGKVVQAEKDKKRFAKLPLKVGMYGSFGEQRYQVVGLIRYVEKSGGTYYTQEYLLYCPEVGYRWLTLYDGHWTLEQNMKGIPTSFKDKEDIFRRPLKSSFVYQGHRWKFYERGIQHIDWIEGELPWVAKKGDMTRYTEAICPPFILTAEESERELEWNVAKYISPDEVADAFKLSKEKFHRPQGVWGPMPNSKEGLSKGLSAASVIFCFVALILFVYSFFVGEDIFKYNISGHDYAEEHKSEAFKVVKAPGLFEMNFDTNCSNSWVYLKVGIIDDQDNVLHDFTKEISYYHGAGWTEGSRSASQVFKLDKAGDYRIFLAGEAGRGESGIDTANGPQIRVTVQQGVMMSRYLALVFIIILIVTFISVSINGLFEKRRWSHLEED